jgi:hypothetical protein
MRCRKFTHFHQSLPIAWLAGVSLALIFVFAAVVARANDDGATVRWDIISLHFGSPNIINPGGVAFAQAPNHVPPNVPFRIKLTGAGTFPARRGPSNDVRGGGTWQTFNQNGTSTGSGTYRVTGLASWEFDSFQTPGFIDNIADASTRANGNAVLRIRYSDGSRGVLLIGCHGPGASNGIVEGVGASKNQLTYWYIEMPPPGQVNINRTVFHVLPADDDDDDNR